MTFSSSQVPRAEQLNAMLRQTIQPYASSAARDTALAAVLKEGMLTYLEDSNTLTMYDGAAWNDISNDLDIGSLIVTGDLTVDTDTLHVDSTLNRVGIGTTAPGKTLDVADSGTAEVRINSTDSVGDSALLFGNVDDSIQASVKYDASAQALQLRGYNNTVRMTIDSAGEVGIGTETPIVPLHIADGTSAAIILDDTGGTKGAAIDSRVKFFAGGVQNGSVGYASGVGIMQLVNIDGPLYLQTDSADSILLRTSGTTRMTIASTGAVDVVGAFSKGSGSFKIDHPLPAMTDTHHLVHSFVEGPQADLIYRGTVDLVAGTAQVNIDTASNMTAGTFEALCRDVACWTSNEDGWTAIKGSVAGNMLTVTAQDDTCTDTISWLVIGERCDPHIIETGWTDDDGKVIVEPFKLNPVDTNNE